ncbi:DUF5336 domain-containing protein [Allokutzneria oryzae]|uniref:DUF5336 domain-containing protein n=1 Tax=Allokutzneria oryzae TaxID=1378989 RepID=A0ABV6A1Y4_9PSEU
MSVPYGAPQPNPQQPGVPGQPGSGPNLGFILSLVAAGLGLVAYLCGFSSEVRAGGGYLLYLLLAAVLAGFSVLPQAPKLLWAAAPLAAVPALLLLQGMVALSSISGMFVVVFIVALLQAGATVVALLVDIGVIKIQPKPQPYGPPGGWNPASGGFPQPYGQQPGQFGQQPQQFGQQPQQPQQTQQFGQPGTPPGGFGQS